jgi:hypothetical protein
MIGGETTRREESEEFLAPYVTGHLTVRGRKIPVVSTVLRGADIAGGWRVRWDIGRSSFTVPPGLYAVGAPGPASPVLVTANYKLTFDRLRARLGGIDAWILVLDTRGVNVWCAAGKGTFGTRELVDRIIRVRLGEVVSHSTLILPQLSASGVSAPEVKKIAKYSVIFGPVRARDIPTFLARGLKKDDGMRKVEFRLPDRMAVAPVELVHSWPFLLAAIVVAGLFALPAGTGYFARLFRFLMPYAGAVAAGTLVFPALLPYLPFRAFSLKGAVLGAVWSAASALLTGASPAGAAAIALIVTSIVSYLAMNFTGSSTYTCQTGAELEVKRGSMPMACALIFGVALMSAARFGLL